MTPNEVADRYFECIRARDVDGLVALYAEDATVVLPDGREIVGAQAIRSLQEGIFSGAAPFPTPGNRVVGDRSVAVEIRVDFAEGRVRRTANFFNVNEAGRIERLGVYAQGS